MNDADPPYDQLRARYARSLVRKHAELAQAWHEFAGRPGDAAAYRDLHALIHRLSGSASSYGYPNLGALAHKIDELMSPSDAREPAPADFARALDAPIRELLGALGETAALAMKNPPVIP